MAELRQLVASLGHGDVATYIQSGNVVFTPSHADRAKLVSELRTAIAEAHGIDTPVIVLTRDELATVIDRNPYPKEPNPRYVHGVFLPAELDEAAHSQIRQAADAVKGRGSADEVTLLGRTLYLHTPDGFGTSELAKILLTKRTSPVYVGTARNWNTITKMLTLCDS